jgi:hypothetical protein
VVSILILSPILFAILVAVFGGPNKSTQDTSQAPIAPPSVAPAAAPSPPPPATPSALEYRDAVVQESKEIGESLVRNGKRGWHPHDDSWRKAEEAEFALWQADYERAQKRVPPPQLAEVNAKYVHALGLLADAGRQVARGIDDDNPAAITAGTKEMWEYDAEFKAAVGSGLLE